MESGEYYPHPYGCRCRQCIEMAACICAQDANCEYFFSDEELMRIAESRNEPPQDDES